MNYENACEALNRKPITIEAFKELPEDHRVSLFGEHKLITCIEAMNTEANGGKKWEQDWFNTNQRKYMVFLRAIKDSTKPSGVGFSFYGTSDFNSYSYLGSRLHFFSDDIARKAGKDPDMIQYWNEWML